MKKAAVFIGRRLRHLDVIAHEGADLIVLSWTVDRQAGLRKPTYVLPLDAVSHHVLDTVNPPYHYFVDDPLPESLPRGTAPRRVYERFGVRKGPDVTFPLSA